MSDFLTDCEGAPTPERVKAYAFIQWKGTDACFDFHCDCGEHNHFDGYFAYVVRCAKCGQDWEMPVLLTPRKFCAGTYAGHTPVVMEGDDQ